jgi:hypothetical protein
MNGFGQATASAAAKNSILDAAPEGAMDLEGLAVSLKRYPDTKPEFSRSLYGG